MTPYLSARCSDSNLIDIPVEVESPDHHYYHVSETLSAVFCVIHNSYIFLPIQTLTVILNVYLLYDCCRLLSSQGEK